MANWLLSEDITPEAIKAEIVKKTLDEAPYIERVPVHKAESVIETLARKAANDELTDAEKADMLAVFQGAFSSDTD